MIWMALVRKDLSEIAPKGHWYTHAPQETHLFSVMDAFWVSGLMLMAFILQALMQGRSSFRIAP